MAPYQHFLTFFLTRLQKTAPLKGMASLLCESKQNRQSFSFQSNLLLVRFLTLSSLEKHVLS